MSWLWLIAAFAVGWVACWKLSNFFLRHVLRTESTLMDDAVRGLRHETLLRLETIVDDELAKRRG